MESNAFCKAKEKNLESVFCINSILMQIQNSISHVKMFLFFKKKYQIISPFSVFFGRNLMDFWEIEKGFLNI